MIGLIFGDTSFPIEILINDKFHNYKFVKNIKIEESVLNTNITTGLLWQFCDR